MGKKADASVKVGCQVALSVCKACANNVTRKIKVRRKNSRLRVLKKEGRGWQGEQKGKERAPGSIKTRILGNYRTLIVAPYAKVSQQTSLHIAKSAPLMLADGSDCARFIVFGGARA